MAYSISCDSGNEIIIPQNGYDSMNPLVIQVSCDGETTNNSFVLEYYGDDGITIKRNRNTLNIYVKPNLTQLEKNYTIYLTHSNDSSICYQINLIQEEDIYEVSVDKDKILFKSDFYGDRNVMKEGTSSYYQEQLINVFAKGGSEKWRVKAIYRYHMTDDNNAVEEKRLFDNGFLYTVTKNGLKLKNYGRPFMEKNDYYKIIICHKDDKNTTVAIIINYSEETKVNVKKNINKRKKTKIYQNTNIYLPYEKKKALITVKKDNYIENEVYEIKFDNEINDNTIINGNADIKKIPFKVLKNKEETNLLTRFFNTSQWLKARFDKSNRNIIIEIKDTPISERKAYLRLEIVDHPEIKKDFIVINMPSN